MNNKIYFYSYVIAWTEMGSLWAELKEQTTSVHAVHTYINKIYIEETGMHLCFKKYYNYNIYTKF